MEWRNQAELVDGFLIADERGFGWFAKGLARGRNRRLISGRERETIPIYEIRQ
jgi:hypothetical protein